MQFLILRYISSLSVANTIKVYLSERLLLIFLGHGIVTTIIDIKFGYSCSVDTYFSRSTLTNRRESNTTNAQDRIGTYL